MSKQEVIAKVAERIAAGDLEGAASYYAEDAVLHVDGNGPTSGEFRGRAEIMTMLGTMPDMIDSMEVDVHDMLFSDDHAVLLTRPTVHRGDRSLTVNRVAVYHFKDDQVSEIWLVGADQQAWDEFLS